jgi:lipopolysaccharide export system permease protein
MRKTLYKYLIAEQIAPLSVCFFGLSLILITGRLLQLTRYLFTSSVTFGDLLEVIAFAMPNLVLYALPMATLVGVLLAFVRLSSDNELIALRAAGVGFHQFLPAILSLLVITTLFSFFNAVYLMPSANRAFEMKLKSLGRSILPVLLREGTFIDTVPKVVFFFGSVDPAELKIEGIFVQDNRQPDIQVVIVADHARIAYPPDLSQLIFKISKGVITRVSDNLKSAQAIAFKTYDLALSMDEMFGESSGFKKGRKEMSLSELFEVIREQGPQRDLSLSLEVHRRLALPFSCLLLGLVGAPLGALFRQSGRMTGITVGLGVFLAYYIALSAGKGLGENGLLSPFLAVWLPNLLTALVAVCLWLKIQLEVPLGIKELLRNCHPQWQKLSGMHLFLRRRKS